MIFCTLGLPGSLCESFCDNEHCSAQRLRNWGGGEGGGEEKEPSSAELRLGCGRGSRESGQSPVGSWGCPHLTPGMGFVQEACPAAELGWRLASGVTPSRAASPARMHKPFHREGWRKGLQTEAHHKKYLDWYCMFSFLLKSLHRHLSGIVKCNAVCTEIMSDTLILKFSIHRIKES